MKSFANSFLVYFTSLHARRYRRLVFITDTNQNFQKNLRLFKKGTCVKCRARNTKWNGWEFLAHLEEAATT